MDYEEKAIELFGKSSYSAFEIEDKWNKNNKLKGYISKKATELYGALFITHVNNIEVPQLIYGTPKMHYPFDKQDRYNFPAAKTILVYEKLDGTNILAFTYTDGVQDFLSFKTRLTPTVSDGRWGNFENMWKEMLDKYPNITSLVRETGNNISFELFGARNRHLIQYNIPLDIKVLFAISKNGKIIPPSIFNTYDIPVVILEDEISSDYEKNYKYHQEQMQLKLKEGEDSTYIGQEGQVWYLNTVEGKWIQFKCKPETIESIHFANGGLSKNSILTTCINAFENYDDIDYEKIKSLLLEDFQEKDIEAKYYLIVSCIQEIKTQLAFKERVLGLYNKIGKDINLYKNEIMRELSQWFLKKDMKKVYTIIINTLK